MEAVSLIAIDLAKNVFHLHGVTATGAAAFRAKLGAVANVVEFRGWRSLREWSQP